MSEIKDAVNAALDHLETAGVALAEITPPGRDSLTERLSGMLDDLEAWKADVWEELNGQEVADATVWSAPSPRVSPRRWHMIRRPDQMERVLDRLRAAWKLEPSMRLCQLIVNATGRDDPFCVEDDDLMAALDGYRPVPSGRGESGGGG